MTTREPVIVDQKAEEVSTELTEFRRLFAAEEYAACRRVATERLRFGSTDGPGVWAMALQVTALGEGKLEEAVSLALAAHYLVDPEDVTRRARLANNYAMTLRALYEETGESEYLDAAIDKYTEAADLHREAGDEAEAAQTDNNLAWLLMKAGRLGEALEVSARALRTLLEVGSESSIKEAKDTHGHIWAFLAPSGAAGGGGDGAVLSRR